MTIFSLNSVLNKYKKDCLNWLTSSSNLDILINHKLIDLLIALGLCLYFSGIKKDNFFIYSRIHTLRLLLLSSFSELTAKAKEY